MNRTITQEQSQLHAYVDDQLSEEELRQVEAAIQSNPEALQQVSDYQRLNEQLKALYDPILDEPIPPHLLKPRSTISLWRRIRSLAAAVVFVTLGLVTGLYLGVNLETEPLISGTEADHVIDEAAMAYSVYVPEVRHPVEVRGEQRDHLVTWLSKRMGRQINVPRLAEFDMRLVGGRLLSSEDGPGALLMYENISGSRIIIYACHAEERATAFHYAQKSEISVFYWIDSSVSYAVAAEMDREKLLPLAESVYSQMTF